MTAASIGWGPAYAAKSSPRRILLLASGPYALDLFRSIATPLRQGGNVVAILSKEEKDFLAGEGDIINDLGGADFLLVGTCRIRSIVKNSPTQVRESFAIDTAINKRIPFALISETLAEIASPHLQKARDTAPAMFSLEDRGCPALWDLIPTRAKITPLASIQEGLAERVRILARQE